jgi:hypothetical protein
MQTILIFKNFILKSVIKIEDKFEIMYRLK